MKRLPSIRVLRIIGALTLALALAACSAIKLGYSTLPQLSLWWLDGYVDLSDEQDPRVRSDIAALHQWHRRSELPQVIDLLARIERMAPGEVSPQQACGVVTEVQQRLKAVAAQAEAPAVALAGELSPRQLRHLQRKFRSNNERFRKEWLDLPPQEQREKRFKQMLDRLETVYGTLDEPQRSVLRQRMAATQWDPVKMHAQWQRRQQDLLQILGRIGQHRLPAAESAALLRGWVDRLEQPADPAYRAYQEALLQEGCATFAAVHQSTTTAQREQAARRLRAWQRDLGELAGSGS